MLSEQQHNSEHAIRAKNITLNMLSELKHNSEYAIRAKT